MSDIHPEPADDPRPRIHTPSDTVGDCAFPVELLTRRFGFQGLPLSPEETVRCLNARRLLSYRILDEQLVECRPAPVTMPVGMPLAYSLRGRYHADLLFEGHRIHVEAIAQELDSPGGTNKEIRVYVDGVLEGRSILLGRLGATVDTFPVFAAVGPRAVLSVSPVRRTSLDQLLVEVRERRRPSGRS